MNHAYYELVDREDLTEDNFEEELKKVSDFKFNEKHIQMIKKDVLYGEETNNK